MRQAFSLVELSIVLVILGLLTGGILAGQSLIRASELRAVVNEYQRYMTATQSFRDKYMALPGDMTNATSFWGKDNTNCSGHTGTAATPGTCNGDGSGLIATSSAPERHRFWQQLALAGLIEGTYTGLGTNAATGWEVTPGTNAPASKMSTAGWTATDLLTASGSGDTITYALDYNNSLIFGIMYAASYTRTAVLKPEEAWNIDTKLDDGKPASGKVIAQFWNNACSAADDGTHANNDLVASYKLTSTSIACTLIFRQLF